MKWTIFLLLGLCACVLADIPDDIDIPDEDLDELEDLLNIVEDQQSVSIFEYFIEETRTLQITSIHRKKIALERMK